MPGFIRHMLVMSVALSLTACGIFMDNSRARALRHSPNYEAGYSDGCASANADNSSLRGNDRVRNDELYNSDKAYRAGWNSGLSACRTMTPQSQSNSPIPDMNPGGSRY